MSVAWDCPDWKEGTGREGEEVHAELPPGPGLPSVPRPLGASRCLLEAVLCPPAICDHWCVTSLHVRAPAAVATLFKRLCLHHTTGSASPSPALPVGSCFALSLRYLCTLTLPAAPACWGAGQRPGGKSVGPFRVRSLRPPHSWQCW